MLLSVKLVLLAPPIISTVLLSFLVITLDLSVPCASSPANFKPSSKVATSCLVLVLSSYTIRVMPLVPFLPSTPSAPLSPLMERPLAPSLPLRPMEPSLPLITTAEPSLPFTPILPSMPSLPGTPGWPFSPTPISSDKANSTLAPSVVAACLTVRFLPATISTVF